MSPPLVHLKSTLLIKKAQRNAGRTRNLGHINMEGLFTYLLTRVFPLRIFVPLTSKTMKISAKRRLIPEVDNSDSNSDNSQEKSLSNDEATMDVCEKGKNQEERVKVEEDKRNITKQIDRHPMLFVILLNIYLSLLLKTNFALIFLKLLIWLCTKK